jgi:hypothetical protein
MQSARLRPRGIDPCMKGGGMTPEVGQGQDRQVYDPRFCAGFGVAKRVLRPQMARGEPVRLFPQGARPSVC